MKRFLKFSMVLTCVLVVALVSSTILGGNQVFAANNHYVKFETVEVSLYGGPDVQPNAIPVGAVVVFIAGIVVGYIIDGVLIRYTGASAGEWVARALTFNSENPTCTNIYFSSATSKAICHSGSGGSW
ncbi:hypothetical protein DUZ99_14780 [Xylanibacillus composti]|uniref:Uncharacterized protein n=1 Tax=Xylanibacillus composti TaxID=1572762 RepID=A0A8J4H1Z2_9BACL|nr:hypothetical protein [Xylanibacillus composti]MDT9726244.1 hypothetical protein [Xylanibacillus composti]GIQ68095.1 hypothetical protein XYCOK13_09190 [Xylanibacillus composti]